MKRQTRLFPKAVVALEQLGENIKLARLLANMPVLAAGFPPIVVPSEARLDYIRELWEYQRAVGVISLANSDLLPEPSRLDNLRRLVRDWWQTTLDLVAEAKDPAK